MMQGMGVAHNAGVTAEAGPTSAVVSYKVLFPEDVALKRCVLVKGEAT